MAKKKQTSYITEYSDSDFLMVESKCKKNYLGYPNVIGTAIGLKFIKNKSIEGKLCIQFYVSHKTKRPKRKLPQFVYGRLKDGSIDYSKKIITDIIVLKNLAFACKAGALVDVIGESGTLTLIFKNKTPGQSAYYALTCAHVAGDVRQTPPIDPAMESSCCPSPSKFATTVVNSTHTNNDLAYDIALAQINDSCTPQPELEIVGSLRKITNFLPSNDIRASMTLECSFPVSNIVSAKVSGLRTTLPIQVDGATYRVKNLFKIDRAPRKGDSGGLLYDGTAAVGILVAKSNGFGFFQPISEAFEHLKTISPTPIICF